MTTAERTFPYSPEERQRCLEPLLHALRHLHRRGETIIVGIQGGLGTGKTTLTAYLAQRLSQEAYHVVSFSLDDFYTSYAERQRLAAQHPGNPWYQLFRGMPGTHRTDVLAEALVRFQHGADIDLPVFDRTAHNARGDIAQTVIPIRGRQDFVLFEGWCIGATVTTADELTALCRRHDLLDLVPLPAPDHLTAVLANLAPYQRLWYRLHFLVMLRPTSPTLPVGWWLAREQELLARPDIGMTAAQLDAAVRAFLPITYLCYEQVTPDLCLRINTDHHFDDITVRKTPG